MTIEEWIEEQRKDWKPEIKTSSGIGYHGSNKGEEMTFDTYWNPHTFKWEVTEEYAFQGFLYTRLDEVLRKMK